jgi:hypothetical protein
MTARSQAWGCFRALVGLWIRIPPGARMFVVSVVCCQVEVSASGWSLVQGSPIKYGVAECDREASIMRPLATSGMWNCYYLPYFKSNILSQWMQRSHSLFVVYVLLRCVSVYGVVRMRKIVDLLWHPIVNTLLKAVNTFVLPVTQILYTVSFPTFPSHVSSTYLLNFHLPVSHYHALHPNIRSSQCTRSDDGQYKAETCRPNKMYIDLAQVLP